MTGFPLPIMAQTALMPVYSLISCNDAVSAPTTARIYIHDGFSDTVLSFFDVAKGGTGGVVDITLTDAWQFSGSLILMASTGAVGIRTFDGLSDTLDFTYAAPNTPRGIATNSNLDVYTLSVSTVQRRDGNSATVLSTVSGVASSGIAMCINPSDGLIYIIDNFINGIRSFALGSNVAIATLLPGIGGIFGICFDHEGNMILCSQSPGTIYKYQGASTTLLDSFAAPLSTPRGLGWYLNP